MRFWTITLLMSAALFFFINTVVLAAEGCPTTDSPEVTAAKYQLFAAFRIGYDGYEAPCQMKCFDNQSCQTRCQSKEALRLLHSKLQEITIRSGNVQCKSFTMTCIEQCQSLGDACIQACRPNRQLAGKQ